MNKKNGFIAILIILLSLTFSQVAFARSRKSGGVVSVRGYFRKDGTYVRPYTRSYPSTHSIRSTHNTYIGNDTSIYPSIYNNTENDYNDLFFIPEVEKKELNEKESRLNSERKNLYVRITNLENDIKELNKYNKQIKEMAYDLNLKPYIQNESILKKDFHIEKYSLDYSSNIIKDNYRKYKKTWEMCLERIKNNLDEVKVSLSSTENDLKKLREYLDGEKNKYDKIKEEQLEQKKIEEMKNSISCYEKIKQNLIESNQHYVNYKGLNPICIEQEIKITFSKDIDFNTVNNKTITLISAKTNRHILLKFNMLKPNKLQIIPMENLNHNEIYYLLINNGLKAKDGTSIIASTICKTIQR